MANQQEEHSFEMGSFQVLVQWKDGKTQVHLTDKHNGQIWINNDAVLHRFDGEIRKGKSVFDNIKDSTLMIDNCFEDGRIGGPFLGIFGLGGAWTVVLHKK